MDVFWFILAIIVVIIGIIGCFLPLLPGPPLSYVGMLIMQLRSKPAFTTEFLLVFAAIAIVVTALDYIIPLYGTKKFGGTKYGVWGCTIGLVVGLFIPPWGLILGPFIGALIGEVIGNANSDHALRAAFGSFVGFLAGTLLKFIACIAMLYFIIIEY